MAALALSGAGPIKDKRLQQRESHLSSGSQGEVTLRGHPPRPPPSPPPGSKRYPIDIHRSSLGSMISQGYPLNI